MSVPGPERFLETYYVLTELVRAVGNNPDTRSAEGIGRLVAQLHTMRRMSVSVAGMLQAGKEPVVEASIVKDIGTVWEQQLPHRVRDLAAFVEETATNRETLENQLSFAIKTAPKLTIQGGTTEVLRGIIARGLGCADLHLSPGRGRSAKRSGRGVTAYDRPYPLTPTLSMGEGAHLRRSIEHRRQHEQIH